jgi:hypothetical protein
MKLALEELKVELEVEKDLTPEVRSLLEFIKSSKRGVCFGA